MPLNTSTLSHGNTYKTDTGGEECSIHPSSVLFGRNLASKNSNAASNFEQNKEVQPRQQKVLYSEIMQTTKQYMRCVTDVTYFMSELK